MNQIICPRCHAPNSPDKSFCTNCGQSIAAGQPSFSPPMPNQTRAPKKSRIGLWIAILGGVGLLVLLVGAVGLGVIYYLITSNQTETANNYNSASYSSDQANTSTATNTGTKSVVATTAMTEDEKYRLFYASGKVNDQATIMKVSKKIGIIDESNMPTAYYKPFSEGMVKWAFRDTDFVRKVDTKEKAKNYIDSQMGN